MIFPASAADGDNSLIIVGGRNYRAINSGEIVKSKYRWMVHVDGGCWEGIWMLDGEKSIIIVG